VGNLGRALVPLLHPFRTPIRAYDPWLPDAVLAADGLHPTTLDDVLRTSDVLFSLASVTDANEHLLDARARPGSPTAPE
jgi:phosphoglycerate dehydrogenase-like enzyme